MTTCDVCEMLASRSITIHAGNSSHTFGACKKHYAEVNAMLRKAYRLAHS